MIQVKEGIMESWTIEEVAEDILEFLRENGRGDGEAKAYSERNFVKDFMNSEELGPGVESKVSAALEILQDQGSLRIMDGTMTLSTQLLVFNNPY